MAAATCFFSFSLPSKCYCTSHFPFLPFPILSSFQLTQAQLNFSIFFTSERKSGCSECWPLSFLRGYGLGWNWDSDINTRKKEWGQYSARDWVEVHKLAKKKNEPNSSLQKRESIGASFLYWVDRKSKYFNWNFNETVPKHVQMGASQKLQNSIQTLGIFRPIYPIHTSLYFGRYMKGYHFAIFLLQILLFAVKTLKFSWSFIWIS